MPARPLAITLGDPAGIGPEIVGKALAGSLGRQAKYLLVGDPRSVPLRWRAALRRHAWLEVAGAAVARPGRLSAASGAVAGFSVVRAAREALARRVRGLVTAPLSKSALHLAGLPFPGHTELLARLAGLSPAQVGMLLVGGGLRVFLTTRHQSLKSALSALRPGALEQALKVLTRGLRQGFGLRRPRIALAALNPHAGEDGAFGDEEGRLLKPFVRRHARSRTYALQGPFPADTVFVQALRGVFDAVLCLYHDQALIPLKLLAFDSGVNVTLGLPFVRTSPDHGTAFDIAGKGKASSGSMEAAIRLALKLSR